MAPIREYLCDYFGHQFDAIVLTQDPDQYRHAECRCGSDAKLRPALIGGYKGDMGGSSSRPKRSTAMPSKKAFTGKPGQVDEPECGQLDLEGIE